MKLYIDPGTGSMLFSLAIGLVSVIWFGVRKLYMKLKYLTPGKAKADTAKWDIVIYGEDKRYWTSFKGVLDEFEKRRVKVTYLAGSEDDPLLSENYEYVDTEIIGLGNKAYAKLNLLNARIVLATTPGLDVYQWKRSKNVDWYVHMTHSVGGVICYRMFGTEFYDSILLSADQFIEPIRIMERKRNTRSKDVEVAGLVYMDHLAERAKEYKKAKPVKPYRILLAPSWGVNSILNKYGAKIIECIAQTGNILTIRPHPQTCISDSELLATLKEQYPPSDTIRWNDDSDNFAVLAESDILISDFSGIIFDFAFIFERPVLYTPVEVDLSVRDQAWVDGPYEVAPILPKIGKELRECDFDRMAEVIDQMLDNSAYLETIQIAKDECWQNRGHAAEFVVEYLLSKLNYLEKDYNEERYARPQS